jgi:DNA-binding transcriptional LysR family regulator
LQRSSNASEDEVERTTRRLAPTEAGRRFAERARALLGEYADTLDEMADKKDAPLRGLLRVTATTVFGRRYLAPLTTRFLANHPGMRIELILTERNIDLVEEGVDLAIRIGQLDNSRLVVRRVGEINRVLVASPIYLRRHSEPRSPRDLTRHDVVFYSGHTRPVEWRFQTHGRWQIVRLTPRLMVTDIEAFLSLVTAGQGIGRAFSYQVADAIAARRLVRLLPSFEPPPLPVHIVVPSGRYLAPVVRTFMDQAVRELRNVPVLGGLSP